MLYANFGHNAMNYTTNTRTSSTFASAQQNQWLLNGLLWLGGGSTPPAPTGQTIVNLRSGKCVDVRAGGTGNGTAIQQYACNGSAAQRFQLVPTTGGYARITNGTQSLDVTNVSTADNAPIQTWTYGGGLNQQWQAVAEGAGSYHFVNRNSGKCLDVPAASTADGVQLVQYACNGTAAQSFRLS
jgi:hypothetical protein